MLKKIGAWGSAIVLSLPLIGLGAPDTYFNDSSRVNVMREFDLTTHQQVTTYSEIRTKTGAFRYDYFGNPWRTATKEGGSFLSDVNTATSTITLPGNRLVGSYRVQFNPSYQTNYPNQLVIEGFNPSDGWFPLDTKTNINSYDISGTFAAPKNVTQFRYTAIGTAAGAANQFNYNLANFNLYMAPGQAIPLTGGYSLIHDSGRVSSTNSSPNQNNGTSATGPWATPNSGNGNSIITGNYESYDLKSQVKPDGNAYPGQRSYVTWNFNQAYRMDFAVLSGVIDYTINNWEIYSTNNLNLASLNALATATPATIQGAGWTLQYQQGGSTPSEKVFDFNQPGKFQYLMLVWDGQHPAIGQFEVFGIPEPTGLALVGVGAVTMLRRRRS